MTHVLQEVSSPICHDGADQLTYKLASSLDEREQAFRLVYESYLRCGLCAPNQFGMRVIEHHLFSSTAVFVGKLDEQVVCTQTLVRDDQLRLPMESIYGYEVDRLRVQGHVVAEIVCLADRRKEISRGISAFVRLCRLMIQYAQSQEIRSVLAAVHPRHARFYDRYMSFETIGDEKDYPTVRGNPAVAMLLDLHRVEQEPPKHYQEFFGERLPAEVLAPQPISSHEVEYFRRRQAKTELAQSKVG